MSAKLYGGFRTSCLVFPWDTLGSDFVDEIVSRTIPAKGLVLTVDSQNLISRSYHQVICASEHAPKKTRRQIQNSRLRRYAKRDGQTNVVFGVDYKGKVLFFRWLKGSTTGGPRGSDWQLSLLTFFFTHTVGHHIHKFGERKDCSLPPE